MREIKITLYKYDELPTRGAKERARQWWIEQESYDPAWYKEHFESMRWAILYAAGADAEDVPQLKRDSETCAWTGYSADALLSDMLNGDTIPSEMAIRAHYIGAWENELEARFTDEEYICETLNANEYEFNEDGMRWTL